MVDHAILESKRLIPRRDVLEKALTKDLNSLEEFSELDVEECITLLDNSNELPKEWPFIDALDQKKLDNLRKEKKEETKLELKLLPSHLKYVFLAGNSQKLVIISSSLSEEEEQQLVHVLEKNIQAIGWTLSDLKGISPALCTRRIPIDPESTPSREPQRRLNNAMGEVVKKEVLKLLHAGIIYPVPFSE